MSVDFSEAIGALTDVNALGENVTYTRGAASATVAAVVDDENMLIETPEGTLARHGTRTFLFLASALVVGAVAITPARADTITYGGSTWRYVSHVTLEGIFHEVTASRIG